MGGRLASAGAWCLAVVILTGCGSTAEELAPQSTPVIEESTPATRLAALDATQGGLDRVSEYEELLGQLATRCNQSPAEVGDLIADAVALLAERGESQTHLWLLDEMVAEIPEGEVLDDQSCEVLAGIIVLAEVQ